MALCRSCAACGRGWGERFHAPAWAFVSMVVLRGSNCLRSSKSNGLEGRSPRDNARFVVTNLRHTAEGVHQIYRERGNSENRIRERKHALALDRTSCTRFLANQLRFLLAASAQFRPEPALAVTKRKLRIPSPYTPEAHSWEASNALLVARLPPRPQNRRHIPALASEVPGRTGCTRTLNRRPHLYGRVHA